MTAGNAGGGVWIIRDFRILGLKRAPLKEEQYESLAHFQQPLTTDPEFSPRLAYGQRLFNFQESVY